MSKIKSIIILTIVTVLIAVLGTACFVQFHIPGTVKDFKSVFGTIDKGIDLEGGYCVVMTPKNDTGKDYTDEVYDAVIETLSSRLEDNGFTEATIDLQTARNGLRSLRIEIPAIDDPDEVMSLIGNQGELKFTNTARSVTYLNRDGVADVYASYDEDGNPAVILDLTSDGQVKFYEATKTILASSDEDKTMSIYVGDRLVSAPTVSTEINSRYAKITGIGSYDEAVTIASVIKSGKLQIDFEIAEARQMSATLGENVLNDAMIAAAIGLGIIFVIMILFYGGMGLAAMFALLVYVILYVIVLALFPWVQLTFPGIAGIILSIGMAVDANVIIFDRIKEEYANGKTVIASVDAGFKRAIITVMDSNVTTILAAIVLWILCSGSIKGFAITLFLGTLVSLFTAIVVTRWLIKVMRGLSKNEAKFLNLGRREEA